MRGIRGDALIEDEARGALAGPLVALVDPLVHVARPDLHRQLPRILEDAALLQPPLFVAGVARGADAAARLRVTPRNG